MISQAEIGAGTTIQDALSDAVERIRQHQSAGRFDKAEAMLDELLLERPDNQTLLHMRAVNMVQTGRIDEGRDLMVRALAHAVDNPIQLTDLGVVQAQSGQVEAAIDNFQMAVDVAPNFAVARSNLGAAQLVLRRYAEAIENLSEAIRLEPNLIDAHTNLVSAYIQTGAFAKAIDTAYKALSIDPQSVAAHTRLSAALFRRDRFETAEHHARRAIELSPDDPEAHVHLGNALAASGRLDEAAEILLKVARRPQGGLQAVSRLVRLHKIKPGSDELALLENYLEFQDKIDDEAKATLFYACGKAYDDLGDYERAFGFLHKANAIRSKVHSFDLQSMHERSERLLTFCSPALIERCSGGGIDDVAPIFICGLPRSGTTLMDQMFSRHPDVQAGGELRAAPLALQRNQRLREALAGEIAEAEIGPDDFSRLGEDYVAQLHGEGIRAEFSTDKMPANFRHVGLLTLALPRAKFIVMRRHPLDCLFSNYMQDFGQNQPFSTRFENLAWYFKTFDRFARHWADLFPTRVKEVSYEALTREPETQMRLVLDFVGLDWSPDVLDFKGSLRQVSTASIAQVREPIYSRSVGRWRNYRTQLAPLARQVRAFLSEDELALFGQGQQQG